MISTKRSSVRRWLILAPLLGCTLVLAAVILWRVGTDRSAISNGQGGGPVAPELSPSTAFEADAGLPPAVPDAGDRRAPGEADGPGAGESVAEATGYLLEVDLEELAISLENHLETTLFGGVDVGGMIDIASSLMDLEVDRRAVPVPNQSGSMLFPLLGTPEGMQAQLVVRRTDGSQFANERLSLRIQMDPSSSGGVDRDESEVYFTCWRDKEGRLKDFSILTTLYPSADTQGTVPLGVTYRVSLDDPSNPSIRMKSSKNGLPFDVQGSGVLIGKSLDHDDLNLLNEKLLSQYAKVTN